MPNQSFQRTVKNLRSLPSAEFARYAAMNNRQLISLVALAGSLLLASVSEAAEIRYRLFFLQSGQAPALLSEGVRRYGLQDVAVAALGTGASKRYRKTVQVSGSFVVGAYVSPGEKIDGFGLWLRKEPAWWEFWSDGGFSWEWFDRVSGETYRKRQGPGKVRATFSKQAGGFELSSVQFLEDVTFRLNARPWFGSSEEDTHHMVVLAGSELRIAA